MNQPTEFPGRGPIDFNPSFLSFLAASGLDCRSAEDAARAAGCLGAFVEQIAAAPRGLDAARAIDARLAEIDRLLTAINYKVVWDEPTRQFAHTSAVVVCSPAGKITRFFSGLDYRPLYMRLALTEAGEGKISAGVLDQVLLPCFAFDPSRGQYSAAVLGIVRLAGAATVALVVLFWLGTWAVKRGARSDQSAVP